MPAFVPPVNYVEIVTYATAVARGGDVKKIQNVYHFRRTTTVNALSPANIEATFQTNIMSKVLLHTSIDYTQSRTTVRYFQDADHSPQSFVEVGVGAITGQRYETFTSSLLILKTSQRGQSGIGKKYIGPLGESQINGDTLEASAVTTLAAIGTALLLGFADADGNFWVAGLKGGPRRFVTPAPQYRVNPTLTVWNDFTSFVPNKSLSTMRRRRISTVT